MRAFGSFSVSMYGPVPTGHQSSVKFLSSMPLWWKNFSAPRDRREERHREPVDELRIAPLERHAVGVAVDFFHALERVASQVDPSGRIQLLQLLGVLGQPDDVLGHQAEDRRVQPRVRRRLIW